MTIGRIVMKYEVTNQPVSTLRRVELERSIKCIHIGN